MLMSKRVADAVRRAISESERMKKFLEKAAVGKVERMKMDWQSEEKQVFREGEIRVYGRVA